MSKDQLSRGNKMTGNLYWKKHKVTGFTTDTIYSAWNNEEELIYIYDGEIIQVFVTDFTIDIIDMLNNCKPLLTIELPNNFNIIEEDE